MISFPKVKIYKAVLFLLFGVSTALAQTSDEAMSDLRVALDYYDDGQLKTELFAASALMQPDGHIGATGLVFRCFKQSGETELTIKADNCKCDQNEQMAKSDSKVSMEKEDLKITGTGFVWEGKKERLTLLSNVRVEFSKAVVPREGIINSEE